MKRMQESNEDLNTFIRCWQILAALPFYYFGQFSSFITLTLSATRTLALAKPLYIIRRKFVNRALGACIFILLILFAFKSFVIYHLTGFMLNNEKQDRMQQLLTAVAEVELCIASIMVMTVGALSGISVKTLRNSNELSAGQQVNIKNSRKAALMIVTLCFVYVICNGAWCIMWISLTVIFRTDGNSEKASNTRILAMILNIAMIAINSCVNPIVYVMKNSALNEYTKTHLMTLWKLLITNIRRFSRTVR
jgi:hypothetical protein